MYKEFREKLVQYTTVGVFSHLRPDGDCIGAQVALCLWLEKNGIYAMAFNDNDVPPNLQWMTDYFPVSIPDAETTAQCDAFVVVDGNAPHRFGSYEIFQSEHPRPAFLIDHHPDPADLFVCSISDVSASSTCELVYRLLMDHDPDQIDGQMAKALYTGIVTDTGLFQFDSVVPETLEIAADLMRRGDFRSNEIYERVYADRSLNQLRLMSLALETIRLYENNQIAIMYVTKSMLDETHTKSEDCDGLVNHALGIAGVKAAVLLKDLGGEYIRMSLRSRSEVDVNEWAKKLDGGGHRKAAGARHPGPLESAIHDVVRIGARQLSSR